MALTIAFDCQQSFSAMNKLKRAALLMIANQMAPEEVAGLRSIFQVYAPKNPNCAFHLSSNFYRSSRTTC